MTRHTAIKRDMTLVLDTGLLNILRIKAFMLWCHKQVGKSQNSKLHSEIVLSNGKCLIRI